MCAHPGAEVDLLAEGQYTRLDLDMLQMFRRRTLEHCFAQARNRPALLDTDCVKHGEAARRELDRESIIDSGRSSYDVQLAQVCTSGCRLQTRTESASMAAGLGYRRGPRSVVGANVWCRPRVVALHLEVIPAMVGILASTPQKAMSINMWTVWTAGVMNANMASA
jgi:hypothetical protein